jgi:3-oxoacyl-[acyl-carrier-protein] synthase-3
LKYSKVISTGSYLPENELKNEELNQFPKATIKLIEEKTGIRSRRHAAESECTSDLAARAASACLNKVSFNPSSIDAIVLATSSPDSSQPSTAARVQHALGAHNAFAFDINAVCSGSVYGIQIADSFIRTGVCKNVLVIGAEVYSKILYSKDFSTYPYFGDGAGAMLLVAHDTPGIVKTILKTDGSGADTIQVQAGGSRIPYDKVKNKRALYFQMDGRAVFDFAVTRGAEIVEVLLKAEKLEKKDIRLVIAHQANINILEALSQRLDIEMGRFYVNLQNYGNTAAASALIAFDEAESILKEGDRVIVVTFGGGLTWGASLIEI